MCTVFDHMLSVTKISGFGGGLGAGLTVGAETGTTGLVGVEMGEGEEITRTAFGAYAKWRGRIKGFGSHRSGFWWRYLDFYRGCDWGLGGVHGTVPF